MEDNVLYFIKEHEIKDLLEIIKLNELTSNERYYIKNLILQDLGYVNDLGIKINSNAK